MRDVAAKHNDIVAVKHNALGQLKALGKYLVCWVVLDGRNRVVALHVQVRWPPLTCRFARASALAAFDLSLCTRSLTSNTVTQGVWRKTLLYPANLSSLCADLFATPCQVLASGIQCASWLHLFDIRLPGTRTSLARE